MAETTDAILTHLKGKSPDEIHRTLRNLERMSTSQAEETGQIAARQKAADENLSLNDVQEKLQTAINKGDMSGIERWQELHQEKLNWVTSQMQAREQGRVDKTNQPLVEERQARRNELLTELNSLTQGTVSGNLDRIGQINQELRGLS